MRDPRKIEAEIREIEQTASQSTKLERIAEWVATSPDDEVAYALGLIGSRGRLVRSWRCETNLSVQ